LKASRLVEMLPKPLFLVIVVGTMIRGSLLAQTAKSVAPVHLTAEEDEARTTIPNRPMPPITTNPKLVRLRSFLLC
jgi:hypothetical protein